MWTSSRSWIRTSWCLGDEGFTRRPPTGMGASSELDGSRRTTGYRRRRPGLEDVHVVVTLAGLCLTRVLPPGMQPSSRSEIRARTSPRQATIGDRLAVA